MNEEEKYKKIEKVFTEYHITCFEDIDSSEQRKNILYEIWEIIIN